MNTINVDAINLALEGMKETYGDMLVAKVGEEVMNPRSPAFGQPWVALRAVRDRETELRQVTVSCLTQLERYFTT